MYTDILLALTIFLVAIATIHFHSTDNKKFTLFQKQLKDYGKRLNLCESKFIKYLNLLDKKLNNT